MEGSKKFRTGYTARELKLEKVSPLEYSCITRISSRT